MSAYTGANLRRIMVEQGLALCQVVSKTGLDRRTITAILDGSNHPHSRTIHRLAVGLDVSPDEFFVSPGQLVYRRFDMQTNPTVREIVESHPDLFSGWTDMDFEELHRLCCQKEVLSEEKTLALARRMNQKRLVHKKLDQLLDSPQADIISGIVEVMYREVMKITDQQCTRPVAEKCHEDIK